MKDLIDKINVQQLTVILFLGIALLMSIIYATEDISMAIGTGLVGYLGGVTTSTTPSTNTPELTDSKKQE